MTDSETLRQRNHELSILNIIAQSLNREVDLTRTVQSALQHVADLLDMETGWIFLMDDTGDQTYLAASQNLPSGLATDSNRMQGSCYCLDTYRTGDMAGAANVNVIECTRLRGLVKAGHDAETDGLRYHASIPLYARGKKLGVLNVASRDWRQLSPDDLRLLYTVGDLLSMALERSRLFAHSTEIGAIEERNRLAREMHDTVAQGLTAITLRLETIDALLEASAETDRIQLMVQQTLELTRDNLTEVRRSVLDLRAAPLEGRTLAEALNELTTVSSENWCISVQFDAHNASHPLPRRLESGLYRIAQEALTNIHHHAQAQHVQVRLTTMPERIQLVVEDDGQGFDTSQNITQGHYGLIGMNERVRLLGGRLQISSTPGAGTRLEVEIPFEGNI